MTNRKRVQSRLLAGILLIASAVVVRGEDVPKGVVLPRVECRTEHGYSFALYVPKAYTPEKAWPVIFCFAPDGIGDVPVRLLAPAAERFGYIVAASNDSRNGPIEPIRKAQEVLWKEINARFKVEPKRSYGAGFSGGSRAALYLALSHPDRFAGVISCGAVWAEGKDMPKKCPLALFMLVGAKDFNYFEFTQADKELKSKGVLHWLQEFDGVHQWPPEACMTQGLEYMQAAAMKQGLIAEDKAFLESLLKAHLETAAVLAAKGQKVEALREYRQSCEFFGGLSEKASACEAADGLAQDPDVKAWFSVEPTFEAYRDRLAQTRDSHGLLLIVKELRAKASEGGRVGASADLLLTLVSRSLIQLGAEYLKQRNYREALFCFETILSYRPEDPVAAYNAACTYSRMGFKKDALRCLKLAAQNGFRDFSLMEKDSDLDSIRKEPGYQEVLGELRSLRPPSLAP